MWAFWGGSSFRFPQATSEQVADCTSHQTPGLWFICQALCLSLWKKTLSDARHVPREMRLPREGCFYCLAQRPHVDRLAASSITPSSSLGPQRLLLSNAYTSRVCLKPRTPQSIWLLAVTCDPLIPTAMSVPNPREQLPIRAGCDPDTNGVPERQPPTPTGRPKTHQLGAPCGSGSCPHPLTFSVSPNSALSLRCPVTQLLTKTPS